MKEDDVSVVVVESCLVSLVCTLEKLYNGCRKKLNTISIVPDEFG
jgi:hypothetical protein